ncbi:MAG: 4-hydroxy-tetrahydrodipicolinate reductase [Saprospiraceae bacterium]
MNILLNGSKGRMGQAITRHALEYDVFIAASLDRDDDALAAMPHCDVVVDFSFHTATVPLLELAAEQGKPVVIGTTGHQAAEQAAIRTLSQQIPVVWAGNYAIGVNLLFYLTEKAAAILHSDYHPEIVEMHHRMKQDAPSGTAMNLAEAILRGRGWQQDALTFGRQGITGERPDQQVGIHALRGGEIVGDHTVIFAGPGECLKLQHTASDRRIFAQGALTAARWVRNRPPGLYNMQDVIGLRD